MNKEQLLQTLHDVISHYMEHNERYGQLQLALNTVEANLMTHDSRSLHNPPMFSFNEIDALMAVSKQIRKKIRSEDNWRRVYYMQYHRLVNKYQNLFHDLPPELLPQ